jgi:hypothetical protein
MLVFAIAIPSMIAVAHYVAEPSADYHDYIRNGARATQYDYFYYAEHFTSIQEPTFYALSNFSWALTEGPFLMFAVYKFLTVFFFAMAIYRIKWINPTQKAIIYAFFLLLIFPSAFSNVRNITAIAMAFYAIVHFLDSRKPYQFALLSALAIAFHFSAVIPIGIAIFLFLINKRVKWLHPKNVLVNVPFVVGLSLCSGLITRGAALIPFLPRTFAAYLNNPNSIWLNSSLESGTAVVMSITRTILVAAILFCALYSNQVAKTLSDKRTIFLYGGTIIYLLMSIPSDAVLMTMRIGRFIELLVVLFAFDMINKTKMAYIHRKLVYLGILGIAALNFIGVEYIMNRHWAFPYETIWSHL